MQLKKAEEMLNQSRFYLAQAGSRFTESVKAIKDEEKV